ncbi:putative small G-protein Ras2 [Xylariaceae sp. FL1651]|nr:putative small G-protein Ras2 [Xylariaceae sp. FL1651]
MQSDPLTYRVVVLGDGGVGKTALTLRLYRDEFIEQYDPTVYDSYRTTVPIDGQEFPLEVFDTAGQEDFNNMRDGWIADSEGLLIVYSVTSRGSFTAIGRLFEQVLRVKGWSPQDPAASPPTKLPIMIVGNKCDKEKREVSTKEGHDLARKLGCEFIETSAKDNINVGKAFGDIVKVLRSLSRQDISHEAVSTWAEFLGIDSDGSCPCIIL